MAMHEIYIDGAERKILCDCVEELRMGGNPEKMKKVGHRTMYGTDESEEDKEGVKGTVLGGEGEDVSIVPVVYPRGTVSVSSLGYFSSVGYYSKPSHPYLPISLRARLIR